MKDLRTLYMSLELKNPLIVSSSGLTSSVDNILEIEKAGAGAVVLKSIFEEEISSEINHIINNSGDSVYSDEANGYVNSYVENNSIDEYLSLIKQCKKQCSIPIIASINCFSVGNWISFAKKIELAGADAIEININIIATDKNVFSAAYEEEYYSLIHKIRTVVSIPISVKLSPYFTNIINVVDKLAAIGVDSVVLFNKVFQLDINTDSLCVHNANVFSKPSDIHQSLRWVAILSSKVRKISISSSTGVHSGDDLVKQLLAGADVVQVCSVLYNKGFGEITCMLDYLECWMVEKDYSSINNFRSLLNYKNINNPSYYERVQFMKYFSNSDTYK